MAMLKSLAFACALLALVATVATASPYKRTVSYAGQKVFHCQVGGRAEAVRLSTSPDLDVWSVAANGSATVRTLNVLGEAELRATGRCDVAIRDLEAWIGPHEAALKRRSSGTLNQTLDWFDDYHPYEDIVGFYTALAAEHPGLVKLTPSIGQSIELRPMPAVRISAVSEPSTVPRILLTCQIHAREWVSSSTCMYIAERLAQGFVSDERVRAILDNAEVHIVPFVNPDGYAFSWTNDRLWRKNRRQNSNPNCDGVDLNRNFNIRWAEPGGGSSGNPCSETYHGLGAESEPEIEHLVNYFRKEAPIVAGIDYHSYSQLILRPWGFTLDPPPHEAQLKAIGDQMSEVIRSVHGMEYVSQPGMDLYPTVGTSSDWYFSDDASETNKGHRCAGYTIELRDTGRYGFILPPNQIIPTGEENLEGLLFFIEQFLNNPLPFP